MIEAAAMNEVTRVLNDGVTDAEVAQAIERMRDTAVFARDNFGTASRVFGSALTSGSTVEFVEGWLDRIGAVDAAAVKAAGEYVLKGTHHVTAELLNKPQS